MVEVIPAILTADRQELTRLVGEARGRTKRLQVDIVDGVFADNKTVGPSAIESVDTALLIDFHLMVKEPIDWVEKCVSAGADRVIGQIEMMEDQVKFVEKVQEAGVEVGLAIDLETSVSELDSIILNELDVILVMSVPAGFGGQKFDKTAIDKIRELDQIRQQGMTHFRICVDGGVTENIFRKLETAGADEVSMGRRFFSAKN